MSIYRAHMHYCDQCGNGIRCTEPIIREDSGAHCANEAPGELMLCDECRAAWPDDDADDDADAADDAAWSAR